nr:hypothetical protein [Pandoravirus massiliensis]
MSILSIAVGARAAGHAIIGIAAPFPKNDKATDRARPLKTTSLGSSFSRPILCSFANPRAVFIGYGFSLPLRASCLLCAHFLSPGLPAAFYSFSFFLGEKRQGDTRGARARRTTGPFFWRLFFFPSQRTAGPVACGRWSFCLSSREQKNAVRMRC